MRGCVGFHPSTYMYQYILTELPAHSFLAHLSMEFTRTIRTTQVDKKPIHTGHPSPAEILLYSCGTDRPDRLLYLYHAGWPGLSCRDLDLDIGVNAAGMIRIGRG